MDASTLLAYDPVPIIRLRVCSLLPRLKQVQSLSGVLQSQIYFPWKSVWCTYLTMDFDLKTSLKESVGCVAAAGHQSA